MPTPSFPYSFKLGEECLTPEGKLIPLSDGMRVTVSARYDVDGVASTRSPEDLVGRGEGVLGGEVGVVLKGRGVGGKWASGLKK